MICARAAKSPAAETESVRRPKNEPMTPPEPLTPAAVLDLLVNRCSSELIGHLETRQVEFKREPYRLTDDRQKLELAKDVSALANAAGGVIILGISTDRDEARPWDRASAIRPFPLALINEKQYTDTIQAWVFPSPESIEVRVYPDVAQADHVLAAVLVPRQRPSLGPFIVMKNIAPDGRTEGSLIGYFERRATDAKPLGSHEIQAILRDGHLFRRMLDERASTPPPAPTTIASESPAESATAMQIPELTRERAAGLAEAIQLAEQPTFTLTATPIPRVDASAMFQSEDNPLTVLLRTPPELRDMGFDLDCGEYPAIQHAQLRRSALAGYKGLECWSDGTLLFVAVADNEFLCWGDRRAEDPLRIHPVPLLESTLLFCKLAAAVYSLVPRPPGSVIYTLHLRRMCIDSKPPLLKRGPSNPRIINQWRPAPTCETDVTVQLDSTTDASKVAYALVRDVYTWVGHTYDAIPYLKDDAVDEQAIQAL